MLGIFFFFLNRVFVAFIKNRDALELWLYLLFFPEAWKNKIANSSFACRKKFFLVVSFFFRIKFIYLDNLAITDFLMRILLSVLIVSIWRVKSWLSGSPASMTTPSILGPNAGANARPFIGAESNDSIGRSLRHLSNFWGSVASLKNNYQVFLTLAKKFARTIRTRRSYNSNNMENLYFPMKWYFENWYFFEIVENEYRINILSFQLKLW